MLSSEEINILSLLEELSSSSLPLQEQSVYVVRISELLQAQQEQHEAHELAGKASSSPSSFVKLGRHLLIEAQNQSLENYRILRIAKTKRITSELNDHSTTFTLRESDITSEDALSRSIYETKSESITQILQRMHTAAQNEILQGELNIEELDMSSKTMRDLQEKYSGVNVLLNGSRKLVKILDEAETRDRRFMLASLGFLAFVLLYIIYRRILSGPVKILLWSIFQLVGLAKKVPIKVPMKVPVSSGLGGPQLSQSASLSFTDSFVASDVAVTSYEHPTDDGVSTIEALIGSEEPPEPSRIGIKHEL